MDSDEDESISRADNFDPNSQPVVGTQTFKSNENVNNSNFSTLQHHKVKKQETEPMIVSGLNASKYSISNKAGLKDGVHEKRVAFSPQSQN
jgi:hypothetical protein